MGGRTLHPPIRSSNQATGSSTKETQLPLGYAWEEHGDARAGAGWAMRWLAVEFWERWDGVVFRGATSSCRAGGPGTVGGAPALDGRKRRALLDWWGSERHQYLTTFRTDLQLYRSRLGIVNFCMLAALTRRDGQSRIFFVSPQRWEEATLAPRSRTTCVARGRVRRRTTRTRLRITCPLARHRLD